MPNTPFLAGAATRIITPPLGERPVFLAGFESNRRATGVHSDLYTRALALRLGDQVAILVACDLIGLERGDVEEIRAVLPARDIDPNGLVVACTHTHSGPDTLGLWGPDQATSGVDPVYMAAVKRAVAEAAVEALTFGCPVRMRAAMTKLPGYIANYRTPGLVDDEVAVIQFERPNGEILATLLNLACQPEMLTTESKLISADYPGAACHAVEQAVGGVALHVSGALGGMLSPAIDERNVDGVAAMGRAYAETALAALTQTELLDVTRMSMRRATFRLPLQNQLFSIAQDAGLRRRRPLENGQLTTSCVYIDLGPAQIISVPGELLPRLGFELKAALPGPVRVLAGLADDELGYILPDDEFFFPADYTNPGAQYEESMSVGPRTGSLVLAAAKGLIQRNA